MSAIGIVILLALAYIISCSPKSINWRTVIGAFAIQCAIGAFILYFESGIKVLAIITDFVGNVIGYSESGIEFLFGPVGNKSLGFIFAFNVLPVIIFFSSLISVLYHLRIMNIVISAIGGALQKLLKTTRAESTAAAANIFVGQTEAPLVVKPYIQFMTKSELFALMVGGLASVAGSVMVGYAGLGVELKYLLAASFMAAPGGLLMAKLILPETEVKMDNIRGSKERGDGFANVFDAAASGAASGLKLALNVGAMLLAFVGLLAMVNGAIGWVGNLFGHEDVSLQFMLGYVLQPIAWAIGVPWSEAQLAASFIGQKIVINEFVAYIDFINHKDELSINSQAIVTFALCGFANLSSIAILMGGIGSLVPKRRREIASLGLRAIVAATLANLMSASLAGLYLNGLVM